MTFWRSLPLFLLGLATGLLVILAARVAWYDFMGFRPNMHPGIVFYFSPIIFVGLLIVTLPLEAICRRLSFVPSTHTQAFIIGAIGSSILSVWAFRPFWYLVFVINPPLLRWLFGKLLQFQHANSNHAS